MLRHLLMVACVFALLGGGCDSCATKAPVTDNRPKAPVGPTFGALEGTVRLAAGTELPEVPPTMMFRQFMQQEAPMPPPAQCTPAQQTDRRPVRLGPGNVLSSIFVAASEFKTPLTRPPMVHEVTIKDCRLTPSVVGAMRGDTLRISSETDFPFMPQMGGSEYVETLIKGQQRDHALEALGVTTVLCAFTAPCGRADVITVAHPIYALSDDAGHFRIEKVPANETFNVNAWHPLFRPTTQSVTVKPGETTRIELVLSPEPQYTPSSQAAMQRQQEEAAKQAPAPGSRPE